jgi:hypothetical protein
MNEDYLKDKRIIVIIIIGVIIVFGSVMIYWLQADRKADRENLNEEFAGIVDHVSYDIKQFPTIEISDSSYYIGSGYDTDHQIAKGDSLIKKRGSEKYKLIKHGSNKVIFITK